MRRKTTGHTCNVLVAGETGVGKSTLINYLVDKNVAKTGVGLPKTTWKDSSFYNCVIDGIELLIFDSPGIEVNKTDDWEKRIQKIVGSDADSMSLCPYVVIYCISCGGQRFQQNDAVMIDQFKWQGASVVIALTKCDQVSTAITKKMRAVLPESIPIVEISSGGALRCGKTKPFGKKKLVAEISKCVRGCYNKCSSKVLRVTSKPKQTKSSRTHRVATRKTKLATKLKQKLVDKLSLRRKDVSRSSRNMSKRSI